MRQHHTTFNASWAAALLLLLAACNLSRAPEPTPLPPPATITAVPLVPTPTLPPLAITLVAPSPEPSLTPQPAPPSQGSILFLGDSITQGWKVNELYDYAVNGGRTSDTSGQVLARYRQLYASYAYDTALLLVGINDITGGVPDQLLRDNIAALADSLRNNTNRILIGSLLPVSSRYEPAVHQRIIQNNAWLRDFAASQGFDYVDFFTPLSDSGGYAVPAYFLDGLHPSQQGYDVMARVLADVLG